MGLAGSVEAFCFYEKRGRPPLLIIHSSSPDLRKMRLRDAWITLAKRCRPMCCPLGWLHSARYVRPEYRPTLDRSGAHDPARLRSWIKTNPNAPAGCLATRVRRGPERDVHAG